MSNDALNFDSVTPITVWDRRLVGCEPITRYLSPHDPGNLQTLRESWEAAQRADRECYLVEDRAGKRAVWQETHDFWKV